MTRNLGLPVLLDEHSWVVLNRPGGYRLAVVQPVSRFDHEIVHETFIAPRTAWYRPRKEYKILISKNLWQPSPDAHAVKAAALDMLQEYQDAYVPAGCAAPVEEYVEFLR